MKQDIRIKKIFEDSGKFVGFNLIMGNEEIQIGRSSYMPQTFYIKRYSGYAEVLNTSFNCYNWTKAYQFAVSSFINP